MTESLLADRVERNLYFRESDHELFRLFAEYVFLTPAMLHELTGRNIVSLRSRLRTLYTKGFLQRTTEARKREAYFRPPPFAYHLARKGAYYAASLGYLDHASWTDDKSSRTIEHDLAISDFHIRLSKKYGKGLTYWNQYRADLKDSVNVDGETIHVIPDAIFTIEDKQTFLLEMVRAKESEYDKGESNIMRKARAYLHYPEQFRNTWAVEDFKAVFVLPTLDRMMNFLDKLHAEFPYKRFLVSCDDALDSLAFWDPKEWPNGDAYGLLEETIHN